MSYFSLFGGNDDEELGIKSRRTEDIQLPSRGKPDPRIKRRTPDILEGLRKAGEGLKKAKELGGVK